MPRCVKIMPNCAWVMRPRCLRFSTTLSLDCLLDKGPPMLLRPDAHSPIISTEHSLLSWLKEEIRLCNSPGYPGALAPIRNATFLPVAKAGGFLRRGR